MGSYSDGDASRAIAAGLSADINALRPGMSVALALSSLPPDSTLSIQSNTLYVKSGSSSTEFHLDNQLPDMQLVAGTTYTFSYLGSTVEVSSNV